MTPSKAWVADAAAMAQAGIKRFMWLMEQLLLHGQEARNAVLERLEQGRTPSESIAGWYASVEDSVCSPDQSSDGGLDLRAVATQRGFTFQYGEWWTCTIEGATLLDEFHEFGSHIRRRVGPFNAASDGLKPVDGMKSAKSYFEAVAVCLERVVELSERKKVEDLLAFVARQARAPLVEMAHGVDLEEIRALERCGPNPTPLLVGAEDETEDRLLPIDEAARQAGWPCNRAGRCDRARRAAKWKRREPLPTKKVNGKLCARVSDCVKWKPLADEMSAAFARPPSKSRPLSNPAIPRNSLPGGSHGPTSSVRVGHDPNRID